MDYTVTQYREEYRKQVVDLHTHLFSGSWRLSRSYLRWKYEENPFIESPLLVLVRHGARVVGMRGLFGTSWHLGARGERVVLPHADDLIVHPDHRNRGIFLLLHEATVAAAQERGFPALLSLSGRDSTQKLSLATGWKALGDLQHIYRHPMQQQQSGRESGSRLPTIRLPTIRRGRYRLGQIARGLGFSPGRGISNRSVDEVFRELASPKTGPVRITQEADHAGMSSLAEAAASSRFRAVRSEAFLRWRLRNPDRKYRFLYWRDSSLRGFMILAWPRPDKNMVSVCEYAAADDAVLDEMLEALARAKHTETKLMSSTLSDSHRERMDAAGFVPDPDFTRDERRRFLYFPLTPAGELEAQEGGSPAYPTRWRVSLIDTMHS